MKNKKFALVIINIISVGIPIALVTNSLVYINQTKNLYYAIPIFLLFSLILAYSISFYYENKEQNKKLKDGYKIEETVNIPNLILSNFIFLLIHLLFIALSFLMLLTLAISNNIILQIIFIFSTIGCVYLYLLFVIWFRWYFTCPNCNHLIYGNQKNNNKLLYFSTMIRIFKYKRFTCMYCHAHYHLITQKNSLSRELVIKNKHEPDFIIQSIKKLKNNDKL